MGVLSEGTRHTPGGGRACGSVWPREKPWPGVRWAPESPGVGGAGCTIPPATGAAPFLFWEAPGVAVRLRGTGNGAGWWSVGRLGHFWVFWLRCLCGVRTLRRRALQTVYGLFTRSQARAGSCLPGHYADAIGPCSPRPGRLAGAGVDVVFVPLPGTRGRHGPSTMWSGSDPHGPVATDSVPLHAHS